MSEEVTTVKRTFAQIRSQVHFSIPELAGKAQLNTLPVYLMLLGKPVPRWQAEEVLKALSEMKNQEYSLDTVAVVLAD